MAETFRCIFLLNDTVVLEYLTADPDLFTGIGPKVTTTFNFEKLQ